MKRSLTGILFSFMLVTACGQKGDYPNMNKWVTPYDPVPLRGAVKEIYLNTGDSGRAALFAIFDRRGNMLETNAGQPFSDDDRTLDILTHYEYYDDNMMKRMVAFLPAYNKILTSDTFVSEGSRICRRYSTINNQQSLWDVGEEGNSTAFYTLIRYNDGRMIMQEEKYQTFYNKGKPVKDEFIASYQNEYNDQGKIVKISSRGRFDKEYKTLNLFFYSTWPVPDSIKVFENGAATFTISYVFDKLGNIIEKRTDNGPYTSFPPQTNTYIHKFDQQGNWIQRETVNDSGKIIKTEKRKIIYREN